MSEENLWGEIPLDEKIETPLSILKAQAVALNKVTKGILDGRVVQTSSDDNLIYEFRIVAPTLGNYSATILKISHDIALYPVFVIDDFSGGYTRAPNSEALKEALKSIFQSEPVRRIVRGLAAQATETASPVS
ncbi:MAG TPA: hypothetical protein VEO95_13570 [Chthoniobacteraceae bacterium]|nr:hypothetical protein [Chthoniobacteraceae bacterium]